MFSLGSRLNEKVVFSSSQTDRISNRQQTHRQTVSQADKQKEIEYEESDRFLPPLGVTAVPSVCPAISYPSLSQVMMAAGLDGPASHVRVASVPARRRRGFAMIWTNKENT